VYVKIEMHSICLFATYVQKLEYHFNEVFGAMRKVSDTGCLINCKVSCTIKGKMHYKYNAHNIIGTG
jgi:hypothetical protein